jgi:hypothetical protein
MPEVIHRFIDKDRITELPEVYESIWGTYKSDVEKYASNETKRKVIKHIMTTAHLYVDKRIKLQNFGQSNYRSREVGEAFRTLNDQLKCHIPTNNNFAVDEASYNPNLSWMDFPSDEPFILVISSNLVKQFPTEEKASSASGGGGFLVQGHFDSPGYFLITRYFKSVIPALLIPWATFDGQYKLVYGPTIHVSPSR